MSVILDPTTKNVQSEYNVVSHKHPRHVSILAHRSTNVDIQTVRPSSSKVIHPHNYFGSTSIATGKENIAVQLESERSKHEIAEKERKLREFQSRVVKRVHEKVASEKLSESLDALNESIAVHGEDTRRRMKEFEEKRKATFKTKSALKPSSSPKDSTSLSPSPRQQGEEEGVGRRRKAQHRVRIQEDGKEVLQVHADSDMVEPPQPCAVVPEPTVVHKLQRTATATATATADLQLIAEMCSHNNDGADDVDSAHLFGASSRLLMRVRREADSLFSRLSFDTLRL
eukprot:ANDGO_04995.mRNA.1 hypothetical protein